MTKIDEEKKSKEEKVVNKVFGSYGFKITPSEPLDFILTKDNHSFGVEVTSFFYNQGFARLKNKPNYRNDVQNNVNIHKDDIKNLMISSLYIKNPIDEKYHFLLNSVKYPKPTPNDFVNKIIEIIKQKNTRINGYTGKGAEWFELLIYDEENYFYNNCQLPKDENDRLLEATKNSIFETIYILSNYQGKDLLYTIGTIPDFLNNCEKESTDLNK